MYEFACSADGKYSVALSGKKLTCSIEGRPFWQEELPYEHNRLLCIGNNANIITISDESIVHIIPEKNATHKIIRGLTKADLLAEKAVISALYINESGSQLCVGKVKTKPGIRTKLKKFFSLENEEKFDMEIHELLFISLVSDRQKIYFDGDFNAEMPNKFRWAVSKDFNWLAIAEPSKTMAGISTLISLINVQEFTKYTSIKISGSVVDSIYVNKEGTIAAENTHSETKSIELLYKNGFSKQIIFSPQWKFRHLGNNYLVFQTPDNRIIAKNFDDKQLCDASLAPLDEMDIPYYIHFMDKNNINIIEAINDELKVVRTTIEMINIDAKRWRFIQNSIKEQKLVQEQQKSEQDAKDLLYKKKKEELAATISVKKNSPVKLAKSTPQASEEEYDNAVLSNIISPETVPEIISSAGQFSSPPVKLVQAQKEQLYVEPPEIENELDDIDLMRRKKVNISSKSEENKTLPKEIVDQLVLNDDFMIPTENVDSVGLMVAISEQERKKDNTAVKRPIPKITKIDFVPSRIKKNKFKALSQEKKSLKKENNQENKKEVSLEIKPEVPPIQETPQTIKETPQTIKETPQKKEKTEKAKVLKLMEMLDEKFIQGDISEAIYKELKAKYWRKLKELN